MYTMHVSHNYLIAKYKGGWRWESDQEVRARTPDVKPSI